MRRKGAWVGHLGELQIIQDSPIYVAVGRACCSNIRVSIRSDVPSMNAAGRPTPSMDVLWCASLV